MLVGDLLIWGPEEDGVVLEGGAAGGGARVAEERWHRRRAPHEDHRPAQGQRMLPARFFPTSFLFPILFSYLVGTLALGGVATN